MIHVLHGNRETVDFDDNSSLLLYNNTEYENYPNHWHIPAEIIMPTQNWYHVECAGTQYHLREGDVLLISPGALHQIRAPEQGRRMIFLADLSALNRLSEIELIMTLISPALCITPESDPDIHAAIKAGMEKIFEEYFNATFLRETCIYANLIQMLAIIGKAFAAKARSPSSENPVPKSHFEQFVILFDYINAHYNENLTLEAMANMAGFSKYYFTRLFKQVTGLSFYKYLNQTRISFAAQLLSDPSRSIAEVATCSGFSTLSAFIRMFKIHKKCTPTAYRKMYTL